MTTITRRLLVLYTPEQMYNLVNDVEAYPLFLPWCNNSTIISKSEDVIAASLDLTKGGICRTFSTRNTLIEDESITIEMIDGPFRHLEGCWQFEPFKYGTGCQIQLHINFDFSNRIIKIALEPIFTQILGSLVNAFYKRAQDIYGNN
ncbi:MAG: type II toxin-antitoxin system RatA family toxin [Piscirickettsiaceae bacterium]|nr:type II toxin-antitoxin system RatA family toxin [Piscirickettsiaceae bacterium]